MNRSISRHRRKRGFALVITLSLMVLLTLLAVGLLSLSSISLRSSAQGNALQMARANARVALMLALGDLQKHLGQDNRVTATADQFIGGTSGQQATTHPARHFLGAYKSWDIAAKTRPAPEFVSWFVSGARESLANRDWASTAASGNTIRMVSEETVGKLGGEVKVPFISQQVSDQQVNQLAWWVSDLGTKGLIGKAKERPKDDLALIREDLQSMPATPLSVVKVAEQAPFQGVVSDDPALGKVFSFNTAALLAAEPLAARGTIHDLTAFNRGLLTNVRRGGFRSDLSMYLEKANTAVPTEALYKIGGKDGINMGELWLHYSMYKELRKGGRFTYTTGGSMPVTASYLQMEGSLTETLNDKEYYYKQPTFIQYQTLLSFHARTGTLNGAAGKFLQLVVDPVVTYWNPLDVPVVVTPAYNSIKFWQLPYDVKIQVGNVTATTSLQKLLGGGEWHYLTLIAGKVKPLILKPGEVLMVSQGPNTPIYQQPNKGISNNYFDAVAGWNFGGGIAFDMVDASNQKLFFPEDASLKYEVTPNSVISSGSRRWSINHHECYFKEDRAGRGESIGIGGIYVDYIYGQPNNETTPKPDSARMVASAYPKFFGKIPPASTRTLSLAQITDRKEPFMLYSYRAKTERGSERAARFMSRFNPKAMLIDFYDLTDRELDVLPFEVQINPINSFKTPLLEVSTNGNGYYGGGTNAQDGTSFISTHSVPREPIYSLGAMQHAFANGFGSLSPQDGYAVINGRQPFLPQICHPIGNSFAPAVLASNKTDGSLGGGRLLADHSYLANQALWDDWFFSSIAPQTAATFTTKRSQQKVAEDFMDGVKPLPLHRYQPALGGKLTKDIVGKLFAGNRLSPTAHLAIAPLLEVEGMFNVNSTSVEAWKIVLSSLKEREVVTRDVNGGETSAASYETPVANLIAPMDLTLAKGETADLKDPAQWVGRRTLDDEEIDYLAKGIVKEVRKRGPFLCLADFVNRRVGNDPELALSGTIQSALDAPEVPINKPFRSGSRQVTDTKAYAFPKAEAGPAATGIPGIVKQADILTPIAPYLSVRSDSFLIRSCGRVADAKGKVIATAYCEAVVQRTAEFLDPTDPPETAVNLASPLNKAFGRRFKIISFRWLDPQEI
jgi:hypothetical protein